MSLIANGSFEADTLGNPPASWSQVQGGGAPAASVFAVQNGWASDGTKSTRITTASHSGAGQSIFLIQSAVTVTPRGLYTFGGDINVLAMPNTMVARCMIEWHDGGGAYISQSYGNNAANANVGSVIHSILRAAVAPVTAATGRAIVAITGGTGVADIYVDNLSYDFQSMLSSSAFSL